METRLEIKNTSQELFLEALRTLVLLPRRAVMKLAYKGMDQYSGVYEGVRNNDRYFSACNEQGVIPMSVNFKYDYNKDLFFPGTSELLFANTISVGKDTAKTANECITKGGKIHILSFDIGIPAEDGLHTFLEKEVDKLLEQDYKFCEIDVVFSYLDEDCVKADNALFYFRDSLNLRTGYDFKKKDSAQLIKWFKNLQKKYEK